MYTSTVIAPANTVSAAVGGGSGDARLQSTVTTLAALLGVENECRSSGPLVRGAERARRADPVT